MPKETLTTKKDKIYKTNFIGFIFHVICFIRWIPNTLVYLWRDCA